MPVKAQITNYIKNGSFEDFYDCSAVAINKQKGWAGVDTLSYGAFSISYCNNYVPNNNWTYQFPRTDSTYALSTWFAYGANLRGYLKNRLKANLHAGKTYCAKFYVNIANTSPFGMDGFGIYFGDNTIDTITKPNLPLTYLNPQVKNPSGNIIKDTLNWVPISGTFVATGTEKYALLGNFLADNAVATVSIGGPFFPGNWTDVCIDDVSCIELDLPAFAGRDTTFKPGDSLFLGRKPDVGINEACIWYKLPGTTAIDTIAGFWIKPTQTCTYVVKQEICGLIKWDTVVVKPWVKPVDTLDVGMRENENFKNKNLKVYPNPANYLLMVEMAETTKQNGTYCIYNSLGQVIREEEVALKNGKTQIDTQHLPEGVYILNIKSGDAKTFSKRFAIAR